VIDQYLTRYFDFTAAPQEKGTAFVPFVGDLGAILCVKHHRTVGNDNCIRFGQLDLRIPEQRHRRRYVRATVEVGQYDDGALAIFHGPRRLTVAILARVESTVSERT
jgi:hypothetical protein